jgi:hypothetical protein
VDVKMLPVYATKDVHVKVIHVSAYIGLFGCTLIHPNRHGLEEIIFHPNFSQYGLGWIRVQPNNLSKGRGGELSASRDYFQLHYC